MNYYDENYYDSILSYFKVIVHQMIKKNSKINEDIPISAIDPLHYYIKDKFSNDEILYYTAIGEESIKNHEFAVVTMAGGQRHKAWI